MRRRSGVLGPQLPAPAMRVSRIELVFRFGRLRLELRGPGFGRLHRRRGHEHRVDTQIERRHPTAAGTQNDDADDQPEPAVTSQPTPIGSASSPHLDTSIPPPGDASSIALDADTGHRIWLMAPATTGSGGGPLVRPGTSVGGRNIDAPEQPVARNIDRFKQPREDYSVPAIADGGSIGCQPVDGRSSRTCRVSSTVTLASAGRRFSCLPPSAGVGWPRFKAPAPSGRYVR